MRFNPSVIVLGCLLALPALGTAVGGPLEDGKAAFEHGDYATAIKLLLPLARSGDASAQYDVGTLYINGLGVPQNLVEGQKWLHRAADQGLAEAQSNIGSLYDRGLGVNPDPVAAASWYRKAADQGYDEAQFNLAVFYRDGRGVSQDYSLAAEWWQKAADKGYADAQYALSLAYDQGQGVSKDHAKAIAWLRKSAEGGSRYGQTALADLYQRKGVDGPPDIAAAIGWYRKAADQGYAPAQLSLAQLYDNGEGVARDWGVAFDLYQKAACQEDPVAQFHMSVMYYSGWGVSRSLPGAWVWMDRAISRFPESDATNRTAATTNRDLIASQMNPSEAAVAQNLKRTFDFACPHIRFVRLRSKMPPLVTTAEPGQLKDGAWVVEMPAVPPAQRSTP
ncbi:tetratricopeptide repeat protein [Phenylobacterium montanum]|uniref:Sel1 repeat family protein n=1 Tax=Phenylobacterium montanum TaxID=2823693 RepID=A0A975G370_9CAUL|nr:tetratricopeptide repeat protein [Caulobacter sp. S6]QUD89171.1 sel1 repeat family protein [Caulobacter sp. S6]